MSLFDKIFRKPSPKRVDSAPYFKTFTEYAPAFSTFDGSLYEMALTRAAVDRIATACSKLKPEVIGSAKPRIQRSIKGMPNDYTTWPQMLYRMGTLLETDTNLYVVKSYDENMNVTGIWPLKAEDANIVEYQGVPYVRFQLASGDTAAVELDDVCIINRFQYESDFFGSGNGPINPTLKLLDKQDQAQENAIKSGATIRFMAGYNSQLRPEDIEKKRKEFSDANLSEQNTSGLLIYDTTFKDVKQVDPQSYTISSDEMQRINDNVYSYFGVSESIIMNDYTEEQYGAFYEGVIEPIAVQLGEGLSKILYTRNEISRGNRIMFSSNRLEYASNASKRNMIRDMVDRRIMTINEAREVLQLPPVTGGDIFVYRGEYVTFDMDGNIIYQSGGVNVNDDVQNEDFDLGGDDQEYGDTDARGNTEGDED